jgi:hypothetical protein
MAVPNQSKPKITRTHNLDRPSADIEETTVWSSGDDVEETELGIADYSTILSMLSDLSARPGAYVLREAYSNAYDATMRAVRNGAPMGPVEIELDDTDDDNSLTNKLYGTPASAKVKRLVITDHGCGMTADELKRNFLQYGGSDKRDEVDAIGSKGLGAKAPLAITESFHVTTVKDGTRTSAVISRHAGRLSTARVVQAPTTDGNGTTVTIPVSDNNILAQMNAMLTSIETAAVDIPLRINGRDVTKTLPSKVGETKAGYVYVGSLDIPAKDGTCTVRIWEPMPRVRSSWQYRGANVNLWASDTFPIIDIKAVMNYSHDNVDYMIGGCLYRNDSRWVTNPIVAVEPGWLNFTPSRDEIKKDDALIDFVDALKASWDRIDHAAALQAWWEGLPDAIAYRVPSSMLHSSTTKSSIYNVTYDVTGDDPAQVVIDYAGTTLTLDLPGIERAHKGTAMLLEPHGCGPCNMHVLTYRRKKFDGGKFKGEIQIDNSTINHSKLNEQSAEKLLNKIMEPGMSPICHIHEDDLVVAMTAPIETSTQLRELIRDIRYEFERHVKSGRLDQKNAISVVIEPCTAPDVTGCHEQARETILGIIGQVTKAGDVELVTMDELRQTARETRARTRTSTRTRNSGPKTDEVDQDALLAACTQHRWRIVPIPEPGIPEQTIIAYASSGKPSLTYGQQPSKFDYLRTNAAIQNVSGRWCNDISDVRIGHPDISDIPNCAVVFPERRDTPPDIALAWAGVIALARRHGTDIVPPNVNTILMPCDATVRKSESQAMVATGAIVLEDRRNTIKTHERSVIQTSPDVWEAKAPQTAPSKHQLGVDRHTVFGDDPVPAIRWCLLHANSNYHPNAWTDHKVLLPIELKIAADLMDRAFRCDPDLAFENPDARAATDILLELLPVDDSPYDAQYDRLWPDEGECIEARPAICPIEVAIPDLLPLAETVMRSAQMASKAMELIAGLVGHLNFSSSVIHDYNRTGFDGMAKWFGPGLIRAAQETYDELSSMPYRVMWLPSLGERHPA